MESEGKEKNGPKYWGGIICGLVVGFVLFLLTIKVVQQI